MLQATGPRWLDCSELCCMCNLNFNVSSPAQNDYSFSASSYPLLESLKTTTATATTIPQINALIGWTRENNLTARAARFLVQFFLRSLPNDDVKFSLGTLKQPRRRRWQQSYKFAYSTTKNNSLAQFADALFIFLYISGVMRKKYCGFFLWMSVIRLAKVDVFSQSNSKIPARWNDSQMNKFQLHHAAHNMMKNH